MLQQHIEIPLHKKRRIRENTGLGEENLGKSTLISYFLKIFPKWFGEDVESKCIKNCRRYGFVNVRPVLDGKTKLFQYLKT